MQIPVPTQMDSEQAAWNIRAGLEHSSGRQRNVMAQKRRTQQVSSILESRLQVMHHFGVRAVMLFQDGAMRCLKDFCSWRDGLLGSDADLRYNRRLCGCGKLPPLRQCCSRLGAKR